MYLRSDGSTPGSCYPHVEVSLDNTLNPESLAPKMQLHVNKIFHKEINTVPIILAILKLQNSWYIQVLIPCKMLISVQ